MAVGSLAVRHEPASAALVRHSIADDLAAAHLSADSIADVVLVASELVGNAVLHTSATEEHLGISWDLHGGTVVVCVADPSDVLPQPRTTEQTESGGRGLAIVAAVADEWGVRRSSRGKEVWARVPVTD